MSKSCLYCGKRRKLNRWSVCRECQSRLDVDTYKDAVKAMVSGTGEEEDRSAVKMWRILDGEQLS